MIEELAWFDAVGLIGSAIIVAAYYMATRGLLPADKIPFNAANIAGGSLEMISLIYRPNPGAIVIEVMFLLIAILAILRNLRARA
ncbi:CBU_0592 family membrane protein [Leisingera sp. NJS204]|uniref:CBU_0592 family membrane protein n=1 Tax=Leisingera sp. NJS204 TaxID=2508307 RepID=UPI001013A1CC|nr:hypothetical protein [Leisingera sp. NJS204]QAX28864.1 hypothetical protein ETW24_05535 [Leisingera sp. NJS204]